MNINIGDEITINATITRLLFGQYGDDMVEIRLKNGDMYTINIRNIKTIHPYKEPTKKDMRKGN